jgi:hypothetical protein
MTTSLAKILELGQDAEKFHPLAVKHYRAFLDDIYKDVALDKLSDQDMKAFLSDWDYWLYQDALKSLGEWLNKCLMSNDKSTLSVYPESFPTFGTFWLKSVLLKASQAKHLQEIVATARKEREAEAMRAQSECYQYIMEIHSAVTKFKHHLTMEKKPPFTYPAALAAYSPNQWCKVQFPAKQDIAGWARPKIEAMVPFILRGLVSWDLTSKVLYLPRCKYALAALPSLEWWFKRMLLVKVSIRLIGGNLVRTFRGYRFQFNLLPEDLGCLWLGPTWWDDEEVFATPVALLRLLTTAEMEAPGVTILNHDSLSAVYTIEGYDEDSVEFRTEFVDFIKAISKNQPLPQALFSLSIVDSGTATLLEAKWKASVLAVGSHAGADICDPARVIAKLTELGWSESDAKKVVSSTPFPVGATTKEMVKIVLAKSH